MQMRPAAMMGATAPPPRTLAHLPASGALMDLAGARRRKGMAVLRLPSRARVRQVDHGGIAGAVELPQLYGAAGVLEQQVGVPIWREVIDRDELPVGSGIGTRRLGNRRRPVHQPEVRVPSAFCQTRPAFPPAFISPAATWSIEDTIPSRGVIASARFRDCVASRRSAPIAEAPRHRLALRITHALPP
jgi:hypothetical protein